MIRLSVVFHDGHWRMKVGEVISRPYITEHEAIAAAIRQAIDLGRQGHDSAVIMKAMTCYYGAKGLVRAVPTPRA